MGPPRCRCRHNHRVVGAIVVASDDDVRHGPRRVSQALNERPMCDGRLAPRLQRRQLSGSVRARRRAWAGRSGPELRPAGGSGGLAWSRLGGGREVWLVGWHMQARLLFLFVVLGCNGCLGQFPSRCRTDWGAD